MSTDKHFSKLQKLIKGLSNILNEIIEENNNNNLVSRAIKTNPLETKSVFNCKTPPSISIENYLERILRYSKIDESTLIISLIYLDRVCDYHNLDLTIYNIHRMVLSSILIAIKYNEDDFYSNLYYSKVGGVSISEMNSLEDEFLKLIFFKLWIEITEYDKYRIYLNKCNR